MAYPRVGAEVRLVTDASDFAMGAAIEQESENKWQPLAFFCRKLTSAEKKYSAFNRELAAIYFSIKKFSFITRLYKVAIHFLFYCLLFFSLIFLI